MQPLVYLKHHLNLFSHQLLMLLVIILTLIDHLLVLFLLMHRLISQPSAALRPLFVANIFKLNNNTGNNAIIVLSNLPESVFWFIIQFSLFFTFIESVCTDFHIDDHHQHINNLQIMLFHYLMIMVFLYLSLGFLSHFCVFSIVTFNLILPIIRT